jgi:hypothetical protein
MKVKDKLTFPLFFPSIQIDQLMDLDKQLVHVLC